MTPFPINENNPVVFPGPPPSSADVVVIGGGVVGVCTSLFLARKGLKVVLLEKGRIAGEQSSRNWGWIRQQGRDPDELPIMIEARSLWRELAGQTNEDIGLVEAGVTYLADDDATMEKYEAWLAHATAHRVDTRLIDANAVDELIPGMAKRYRGAMVTPSDMKAEPWVAVPALAGIAAREGVRIMENCAARRLDVTAGRIAGVMSEAGPIAASSVLVAGGAWSSLFLRAHGVLLPQLAVRATVAATEPLPEVHGGGVADERIAFRVRRDGGYTVAAGGFHELFVGPDAFRAFRKFLPQLMADPWNTRLLPVTPRDYPDAWGTARQWQADEESPFERMRVLDPAPNRSKVRSIAKEFASLFPNLGEIRLKAAWAGMIDTMPDTVPVIDRVEALPGLWIGTGLSGHGFGIGPGVGRVLADLISGGEAGHDLRRFRLSRFSDGSPIRLGPSL